MRMGAVKGCLLDMIQLSHCAAMMLCSKSSQQDQSHSNGLHQLNLVGYKKIGDKLEAVLEALLQMV